MSFFPILLTTEIEKWRRGMRSGGDTGSFWTLVSYVNTTAQGVLIARPQLQLQCFLYVCVGLFFFYLGFYMRPKNSHTKHWSVVYDRDRRCLSANGAIAVYICAMYICEMNSDWIICATHITLHMCTLAQQTHTSPITHKHSQFGMEAVFICERKEP